MRTVNHNEQRGFVSIAQNGKVDYLRLAYVQALSIKLTMPTAKYAVIVDAVTMLSVTAQHRKVFDYVIELPHDYAKDTEWKLANEWQVFWLTPFKETIKLEADILIPRDISHWWDTFRLRDVVLGLGCKNYKGDAAISPYRTSFVDNELPDVYSGLMYFRYSKVATDFFKIARDLFLEWETVRLEFTRTATLQATTDFVYAIACNIIGRELTTLPTIDTNFVHMKPGVNGWPEITEFHRAVNVVVDVPDIRINNVQQYYPVHYHYKDFITDEMIGDYERATGIN